jgi:cyclopropane-fatty-acyl-phospholipid synthase
MLGMLLEKIIEDGTLTVVWPNGKTGVYGHGAPRAAVRFTGRLTPFLIALQPDLGFGEAYMDGRMIVEEGTIAEVMEILISNFETHALPPGMRYGRLVRRWFRWAAQFNPAARARKNVAHHYDLSGELYDLFLDSDRQYSCAYFNEPKMTLEQAQAAKKRHIIAKLNFDRPGLSVLDIGSGWGGLGLQLAREAGADVLGITLSTEQLAMSNRRAAEAGLAERCRFEFRDYRDVEGPFDRIVSVGMFEHVGVNHYDEFFGKVRDLLAPDGVALLHTIGRTDGPGAANPWVTKYIFPGGYAPALSEIMASIERSKLYVADVEVLRLHYAETLKQWRIRFLRNWSKAAALYDERFCRMWEFYLAAFEVAFRCDNLVVFQIQLTKRLEVLPITRDYMLDGERAMRAAQERSPRTHEAA